MLQSTIPAYIFFKFMEWRRYGFKEKTKDKKGLNPIELSP